MKTYITSVFLVTIAFFSAKAQSNKCQNGSYLINKSKIYHDIGHNWKNNIYEFRIQEPRVQNPERYSNVIIDNSNGSFQLTRNFDSDTVTTLVHPDGRVSFTMNGNKITNEKILDDYRLTPERGQGYRGFYKTMYGLPMTLDNALISEIEEVMYIDFKGQNAINIKLKLKDALISSDWGLIISEDDYRVLGLEFYHYEKSKTEKESLVFDGYFVKNGIHLPRFRHWYFNDSEYLGSDIIIN